MTGNELLDLALIAAFAGLIGAAFGYVARRYQIPSVAAVALSPVVTAIILSIIWFIWIATTTTIYGHPGGNHPIAVALGATILFGIGFAIIGLVPSIAGCLVVIFLLRVISPTKSNS